MAQEKEFGWEQEKTFPKLSLKGVEVVGFIQKSTANGKKQFALKKVSVDSSNFPIGLSKQFWFPLEQMPELLKYMQDCIKPIK